MPFSFRALSPRLNAFRASSEDVVACASGTSNFCTVASDSPSSLRRLDTASPSASSTFSLDAAVTCSTARGPPFQQFTALSPSTYSVPRVAIEPEIYALLWARWQTSRVTSGVSRVLAGRVISLRVSTTLSSERRFRKGDCRRETVRAVFSVSSKTASPVLLAVESTRYEQDDGHN